MKTRLVNAVLLCALVAGCESVQQLAIKADQTYATSVFALDDLEWNTCHVGTPPVPASVCSALDTQVVAALKDVQAVTIAVQNLPTTVPTTLPTLLSDLNNVQAILTQAAQIPAITALATKVQSANTAAIALLTSLTGK
jgi:hypothetical protein